MMKVDYSWVIAIGVVLLAILLWKPIAGLVGKTFGNSANVQAIERGKVIFYDVERWEGAGSYKSCAMCHAADFVPETGKEIKMTEYVAGKPVILKNIRRKYGATVVDSSDKLFDQVNTCLSDPARINTGPVSSNAKFMQDLRAYVASL